MVTEIIRYLVTDGKEAEFETAYARAAEILDASPFCLNYKLARSLRETNRYLLLIEWESVSAHLEGFRKSAEFGEFFRLVKPYYRMLEEMEHYEATAVKSADQALAR